MFAAAKNELGPATISGAGSPRPASAPTGLTWTFLWLSFFLVLFSSRAVAATPPGRTYPSLTPPSSSSFALADFDGDRKPDLASVEFTRFDSSEVRYSITFRLTSGNAQTVGVVAPFGGLDISVRDVNGDAALDLIVRSAWHHQVVAIFLNDGHGHFAATDPSAF